MMLQAYVVEVFLQIALKKLKRHVFL